MRHAWANFAKDPSQAPISGWTTVRNRVSAKDDGVKDVWEFGTDGKAGMGLVSDGGRCDFWVREGYREARA